MGGNNDDDGNWGNEGKIFCLSPLTSHLLSVLGSSCVMVSDGVGDGDGNSDSNSKSLFSVFL